MPSRPDSALSGMGIWILHTCLRFTCREDKVKNQKKARQNASTEKAVLSSGPGNASEALEMRQKLGMAANFSKRAATSFDKSARS